MVINTGNPRFANPNCPTHQFNLGRRFDDTRQFRQLCTLNIGQPAFFQRDQPRRIELIHRNPRVTSAMFTDKRYKFIGPWPDATAGLVAFGHKHP